MTEGQKINCQFCKTPLIHVKIINTGNNKSEEKLHWQNQVDNKPHFKWAGEENGKAKYTCLIPQTTIEQTKVTQQESINDHDKNEREQVEILKKDINKRVKVAGPFDEAEFITKWAAERAYKMAMADVSDISKLTVQEKSALGQKQGMLTRCLVDTTIELMKIHGIKSKYGSDAFD